VSLIAKFGIETEIERLENRMEPFIAKEVDPPSMCKKRYEELTKIRAALAVVTKTVQSILANPECSGLPSMASLMATVGIYVFACSEGPSVGAAMFGGVVQALDAVQEEAKTYGVALERLKNAKALLVENKANREKAEVRLANARREAADGCRSGGRGCRDSEDRRADEESSGTDGPP
jgi:hypothetical protein